MYGSVFKYHRKPNPRANASFLSIITFSWMLPIFFKGIQRPLDSRDLYKPLPENESNKQGELMERAWDAEVLRARKQGTKPSYLRALRSVYGKQLMLQGILIFVLEFAVRLSQPFFLYGLITNITSNDRKSLYEAYTCAGGIIGASLLTALIMHSYHMGVVLTGMNMRIGTCSLIYRKILSMRGAQTLLKGKIVNLMANDAMRFDYAVTCLHDLWIAPLQVVFVTYFLYRIVGLAAFVGMATMFACAPFQVWMGNITSQLREQTALRSDARINFMSEVINGIHVIKTYAWELHIIKLIKKMRIAEMNIIKKMAVVRGIMSSFQMYHTRCAAALTILAYVLMGNGTLSANKVFMITSFFGVLGTTVGVFFPTGISLVSECYTSVRRVEEFLIGRLEATPSSAFPKEKTTSDSIILNDPPDDISTSLLPLTQIGVAGMTTSDRLELVEVSAKWSADQFDPVLRDVTFSATPGRLVVVIGSVGSGKTSLLHAIMGELTITSGRVKVPPVVSYASQVPWLFAASIRKNILFGEEFNDDRYQRIIRRCALDDDLAALKYSDFTMVGERGVALSGGQKARVNLARAVYKDADVYLLDDPISSVDSIVRHHLLNSCIRPLARKKTVILVTHCLDHLKEDDHIIYLDNGRVKHDGTICDMENMDLMEAHIEPPPEKPTIHDDPLDYPALVNDIPSASMASLISEKSCNEIAEEERRKSKQKSSMKIYSSACGCTSAIVVMFFIAAQIFGSASDYWVSLWVTLEEKSYNATGSSNAVIQQLPWNVNREFCLWVFAVLIIGTMSVAIVRSLIYFFTCVGASTKLHRKMLKSVISAKMQFYYTSKSGVLVADVGLAITQCSGLAYTMEWGLRQSAEVENSLVSVSRIAEYSNLEKDIPKTRLDLKGTRGFWQVREDWPSKGSVEFHEVYMRYGKHSPWVLKGLTFSVKPGQKVAIVGRTGSGKSSIALTLSRLVDFEGYLHIDGVPINLMRLEDLRPRITVIPQDPVLFSGTLRSNLDPLNEYDDSQIWEALKKVEMAEFVQSQVGGILMDVVENGGNLSIGQKQLFCLARGILRSNKIVVLDEATANVDKKTEEIIQRAMKHSFVNTTVITIAHRIHTIMDCDVIIVMENGRIKQIGPPLDLIKEGHGPFHSLVKESNNFSR